MAQQRDVGVRMALGARTARVIRQVLAESFLLAIVGGAIGLWISRLGVTLLALSFPNGVPSYVSFALEPRVVLFVIGVTAVAALLFGVLPAWRATHLDVSRVLREGARTGGGKGTGRLRNGLVVGELALSVILLIGAGLLIRSYRSLTNTELGFQEEGILTARVSLPTVEYQDREKRRAYWRAAWERLAAIPGVESVGSANGVPFSGWNVQAYMSIEGRPAPALGEELDVHFQNVSPGFFETIGAHIVAGRGITAADRDTVARIGVINETLARQQFADQDPVGKRIKYGRADSDDPWITIVGVVSDYRHYRLPQPMGPAIYFPQLALPDRSQSLVLRTSLEEPRALVPAVTRALASLEPGAPAYGVRTFHEIVSQSLWRQRLQGQVLGLFAVLALVLAAVGIYGVISYAVAQRAREIGVRMALGATRGEVTRWVFGQGGRLVVVGLVVGIVGALALTRTLRALLVGVSPTDVVTFAMVPAVLAVVALLAILLPAHRASRVDPVDAMRAD
jgi:predicted permease